MKPDVRTPIYLAVLSTMLVLSSQVGLAGDKGPGRWAVIFAPGIYTNLPDSKLHQTAASACYDRLLKSGFPQDQVIVISESIEGATKPASAKTLFASLRDVITDARPGDLILVPVFSYGVNIGDTDYICPATATADHLNRGTTDELISVPAILQELAFARTQNRCLIVDGAGSRALVDKPQTALGFGGAPLSPVAGQGALISRSGALRPANGSSPALTWFAQSVLDGLSSLADLDGSDGVSYFELRDYLDEYADSIERLGAVGYQRHAQHASIQNDFSLISNDDLQASGVAPQFQQAVCEEMIGVARRALLLERNPDVALTALSRITRYQMSAESKHEADSLYWSALALQGNVQAAWKRAAAASQPLFVVIGQPLKLHPLNGANAAGKVLLQVTPGMVLKASYENGGFLRVTEMYRQDLRKGELRLSKLDVSDAWLWPPDMQPATTEPDDAGLAAALRQLYGTR